MYEYLLAVNDLKNANEKKIVHLKGNDGGLGSNYKKSADITQEISNIILENVSDEVNKFLVDASVTLFNNKCELKYYTIDEDDSRDSYSFQNSKEVNKKVCNKFIKLKKHYISKNLGNWDGMQLIIDIENGKFKVEYKYKD